MSESSEQQSDVEQAKRLPWVASRIGRAATVFALAVGAHYAVTHYSDIEQWASSTIEADLSDPMVESLADSKQMEPAGYSPHIDTASMTTEFPVVDEEFENSLSHNAFIQSLID